MVNKTQTGTMSELRRKRMDEIARSGKQLLAEQEREALMQKLDARPGLDQRMAEADAAAAEYLKKASNQRELRRRAKPNRDAISR